MQPSETKAVHVQVDDSQWPQLRDSGLSCVVRATWKRNTVKSPNRFGQLSGRAKANSNASTFVLPGGPFPNRMLQRRNLGSLEDCRIKTSPLLLETTLLTSNLLICELARCVPTARIIFITDITRASADQESIRGVPHPHGVKCNDWTV